jgi:cytochrome c-550 PedF
VKTWMAMAVSAVLIGIGAAQVLAHGDGAPQPVDTTGLKPPVEDWVPENPYRGDAKAIEIGARGYNSNCARCHGLDVKSGGMAPDLRAVEPNAEGDSWFVARVRGGAMRGDAVKMPPFEGLLSQEAVWAIKSYVDAQPD